MIGLFIDFVAGLFPVDFSGLRSPLLRAYRRAWKRRVSGEESRDALIRALKDAGVPGVDIDPPRSELPVLLKAWDSGVPPREVRGVLRNRRSPR